MGFVFFRSGIDAAGEGELYDVELVLEQIVYDLLKDKLNIVKLTFTSGVNAATEEYESHLSVDRCPWCGIALNEKGVCPKCGYKK